MSPEAAASHPLADLYVARALDPVIELIRQVAGDFVSRPQHHTRASAEETAMLANFRIAANDWLMRPKSFDEAKDRWPAFGHSGCFPTNSRQQISPATVSVEKAGKLGPDGENQAAAVRTAVLRSRP